jgi:lipoprotein-anchoring transpeptidase ErfK/SrfK
MELSRSARAITLVLAFAGWGAALAGAGDQAPAAARNQRSVLAGTLYHRFAGTLVRSLDAPSAGVADVQVSGPQTGATQGTTKPIELSNERTSTVWAYSLRSAPIRAQPVHTAPMLTRLHLYTEDGFPEVYLLLQERTDAAGLEWVQIRIPRRPNGQTGWVPRGTLGTLRLNHWMLQVDRRRLQLTAYRNGRRVFTAPVGVGKRSTPTPAGHFWIRERFKILDPQSGYWPYAFGTSDYSRLSDWPGGGVVGIHGPYHQAGAIPGRISHGCIRLRVSADAWLARHIGLGTPIHVI